MVPAFKERDKHVDGKPQIAMGAMMAVHMGSPKGYPILCRTDENLSTTILKFNSGNIKFVGRAIWKRMGAHYTQGLEAQEDGMFRN